MKIPRKQNDIKVKNFLKYQDFIESLTDEQKEDDVYLVKNTVMIFYDLTEEEFEEKPYQQILDMHQIIMNILTIPGELVQTFKLDGVEYAITPDLKDMTFAELVDVDTVDVLQQICVLYRPVKKRKGDKYIIEKYKADIKHYDRLKDELTLDVYLGFIIFFFNIEKDLLMDFQKYIKAQDITVKQKKTSEQCGDGYNLFMN